ncbi:hypothetical protein [Mycobacterium uberis]|uniref:hypothetical protein n=1 Tax=Mycobacterium uberis TaxID=2162698 RepID=UPI001058F297|nr:hypothetical protein [Mycobacterium uberis]
MSHVVAVLIGTVLPANVVKPAPSATAFFGSVPTNQRYFDALTRGHRRRDWLLDERGAPVGLNMNIHVYKPVARPAQPYPLSSPHLCLLARAVTAAAPRPSGSEIFLLGLTFIPKPNPMPGGAA